MRLNQQRTGFHMPFKLIDSAELAAPVPEFERCLDGPYLDEDPSAVQEVDRELQGAREYLAQAEESQGSELTDVTKFSHLAMFRAARALVYSKGYREHLYRCLAVALDTLFVKPGHLDASLLEAMNRTQTRQGDPHANLEAAARFIQEAERILGRGEADEQS